jgi:hypothetical protein
LEYLQVKVTAVFVRLLIFLCALIYTNNVTRQAVCTESQEAERLWSCLSAVETTVTAADRETATAEAAAV